MPDRQQFTAFQAAWEAAKERARAQGRTIRFAHGASEDDLAPAPPPALFKDADLPDAPDEDEAAR